MTIEVYTQQGKSKLRLTDSTLKFIFKELRHNYNLEKFKFNDLRYKTLNKIVIFKNMNEPYLYNSDIIVFISGKDVYIQHHSQHMSEEVNIEDIIGDPQDLIDNPLLECEEVINIGDRDEWGTYTWTFYKLGTIKGYVNIRWHGESNGNYSESVDLVKITTSEFNFWLSDNK